MNYTSGTLKNSEGNRQVQVLFWSMVGAIVVLAIVYMYLVNKTVWNVVAKQNIEKSMASISSDLSDREFQYINSVSGITMDTATKLGFVPAGNSTVFVARQNIDKSVAIR